MARKVSPGRTGDDGADATLVGGREIETTDADAVEAAGIRRTAIIVVGPVLTAAGFPDSHLYSVARERSSAARERSWSSASVWPSSC